MRSVSMDMTIEEIMEDFRTLCPGEVIIIEYSSLVPVHLAVFIPLITAVDRAGVIVSDIFDQFHVMHAHLSLGGIDTSWIDEIPVVKFGGTLQTGKVIKRISVLNPTPVWHTGYLEALRAFPGLKVVVVLGPEKFMSVNPNIPTSTLCRKLIASSMGSGDTVTVAFINRDVVSESTLEDIREIGTRVFELNFEEGRLVLRVVKSIDPSHQRCRLSVDAQELVDYLHSITGAGI